MKKISLLIGALISFPLLAMVEKAIEGDTRRLNHGAWTQYSSSEEANLKKLTDLLARSTTGDKLLKEAAYKAAQSGLTLNDVIKVGDGSLTDTTLVRKFNPNSPDKVIYESKSVVYLNRSLGWEDALLDLSHELTHYIYRESFNPYSEGFNARDFVKGTIEGEGGEVQAFMTECRVLEELFSRKVQSRSHCKDIKDENGQTSYIKAVQLFYHVGDYYTAFNKLLEGRSLGSAFSELKSDKINFISSAYNVPYPIAALMEYDLVVNKVCENDKKRLAYMQQGPDRSPASESNGKDKFAASYSARCSQK